MQEGNGKRDGALRALYGLRMPLRQVASRVGGFDHVHWSAPLTVDRMSELV